MRNELQAVEPAESTDGLREPIRDAEERRRRFAAYLVASGALTDTDRPGAAAGLVVATTQGKTASRQCRATAEGCMKSPAPPLESVEASIERVAGCVEQDSGCTKYQRCHKLDDIPF
jgi:hypothetical protein